MKPFYRFLWTILILAGAGTSAGQVVRPDLLGSRKGFGEALIGDAEDWIEESRPLYSNTFTGVLILRVRRGPAAAYFHLRHNGSKRQKLAVNLSPAPKDLKVDFSRKTSARNRDVTAPATSERGYRLSVPPSEDARFLCRFASRSETNRKPRRKLVRLNATALKSGKRDQIRVIVIY